MTTSRDITRELERDGWVLIAVRGSVCFPDLPGCTSAGRTLDEAIANARDALAGHVAPRRADGEALPPARSLEAIRRDPECRADLSDVIVAAVPLGRVAFAPPPLAAE